MAQDVSIQLRKEKEKYYHINSHAPPRFASIEDASLFLECVRTKATFPNEKWIFPYEVVNGRAVAAMAYIKAPYELSFTVVPTPR